MVVTKLVHSQTIKSMPQYLDNVSFWQYPKSLGVAPKLAILIGGPAPRRYHNISQKFARAYTTTVDTLQVFGDLDGKQIVAGAEREIVNLGYQRGHAKVRTGTKKKGVGADAPQIIVQNHLAQIAAVSEGPVGDRLHGNVDDDARHVARYSVAGEKRVDEDGRGAIASSITSRLRIRMMRRLIAVRAAASYRFI